MFIQAAAARGSTKRCHIVFVSIQNKLALESCTLCSYYFYVFVQHYDHFKCLFVFNILGIIPLINLSFFLSYLLSKVLIKLHSGGKLKMLTFLQHPKNVIFLCIAYCFLAELRLCDASGTISRGGGRRTRVRGGTRYDGLLL